MNMLMRGILIGAAGVGLVWVGTVGFNRFKENNLEGAGKEVVEFLETVKEDDNTVDKRVKMNDEVVFKLVNTSLDDLPELVNEINKNEKVVN